MPKMRMSMPGQTQVHVKKYSSFKGVDFFSDPTQVEDSRSPDAVNMIADATGCPRKRPGWRMMCRLEAPVRGIYRLKTIEKEEGDKTIPAVDEFIIHAGSKLYRMAGDSEPAEIYSGLTGESSTGFMHDDRLYIMTGKEFMCVDAQKAADVNSRDGAYVPLTSYYDGGIGVDSYMGYTSDFTSYEQVNTLTRFRANSYVLDWECWKPYKNRKEDTSLKNGLFVPTDITIAADATLNDIKIRTEQGTELSGSKYITFFDSLNGYAINTQETFVEHPSLIYYDEYEYLRRYLRIKIKPFIEALEAKEDTSTRFSIIFPADYQTSDDDKSGAGEKWREKLSRVRGCNIISWYNSRLFAAGNSEYANADFYSEMGEPTYFPDINYTEIGNDDSAIKGYLLVGDDQAIIKGESLQYQDASIYLRSSAWDEEQGYYFPVRKGIVGTGGVGANLCATLMDDGMYLSDSGVMGVVTENLTGEQVLAQRSTRINTRLLKEDLKSAAMCVWNGYLLIAVGGHVYLADSRQKSYARNVAGNFEYEWYYWENVPAVCMRVIGTELYFGTDDGKLCKLNTDLCDANGEVSLDTYSDWPDGLSGEPQAIVAQWATKFDDDGDFTVKKNLCRRGCGVFLKGTKRGNVKICVRTDKGYNTDKLLAHRKRSMFSFEDMDFENFSFRTSARMVAAPNRKVKKYAALQIICRSDEINNDFALMGIEKRFVTGFFEK